MKHIPTKPIVLQSKKGRPEDLPRQRFQSCLELELYRQPGVERRLIRIGEYGRARLQVIGVDRTTAELSPRIDKQEPGLIANVEKIGDESKPHPLAHLQGVIAVQV